MVRRYGDTMTSWVALSPLYILNCRLNSSDLARFPENISGAGSRRRPFGGRGAAGAGAAITSGVTGVAGWVSGGGAGTGSPSWVAYSTSWRKAG